MFNNVTDADGQGRAEGEGDRRGRELRPQPLPEDEGDSRRSAATPKHEADRRAGVRIFDEPPGTFNLNTSTIAAASGTWDTDKGMADDYLRKLGHGYGNGFWGESMEDVFRLALSGTEKIVHSSSTMLYGALDNDDMFMYMGGLATAIRNIDGTEKSPEMVDHEHARSRPSRDDLDRQVHRHRVPLALREPDVDRGHEEGRLRRRRRDAVVRRVPVGLGRDGHRDRRPTRCGRRRSTSTSRTSTSSG